MFGISLAELTIILLIAIIFVQPKDLPEIAHFLGRLYYKIRKLFDELKSQFQEAQKELGIEKIKQEFDKAISDEKIKEEDGKTTTIIDIYGNAHKVANLEKIRSDLTPEELENEIKRHNQDNQKETEKETE